MEQSITNQPATQTNTSSEKRPIICLSLFFALQIALVIAQNIFARDFRTTSTATWQIFGIAKILSIILVPLAIKRKPLRIILLCAAILIIVLYFTLPLTVSILSII